MTTREDFDNILKWVRSRNNPTSTTVVSEELDFDLARGYVAKFRHIRFTGSPVAYTDADGNLLQIDSVLLRDPDDTLIATEGGAELDFENDVIYADTFTWLGTAAAAGQVILEAQRSSITFTELQDMITARNCRHNSQMGASVGNASNISWLGYTLEAISDVFIMDLLDIL